MSFHNAASVMLRGCEAMVPTCRHSNYSRESAQVAAGQSHFVLGMIVLCSREILNLNIIQITTCETFCCPREGDGD